MPTIIESGLRVELPAGMSFRFSETAAYTKLKGKRLKEMDFAWVNDNTLFLLEVRSYSQISETLSKEDFLADKDGREPYRFTALIDKITDSVLMLLSVWSGTDWGRELGAQLPAEAQTRIKLKLVVAVDLPPALTVHLQSLRDDLNARLQGRIALADVTNVALMDYEHLTSNPVFAKKFTRDPV